MPSGSSSPRRLKQAFDAWLARFCANRKQAAFSILTLAVAVTLLNIAVAAALPAWSHLIQHDKEEEVIFRGLQYAEAIRVFQIRFGRFPTNLKELRETEPRCLRQLWKNPLSDDGRWALVPAGVGAPIQQTLPPQAEPDQVPGDEPDKPQGPAGGPSPGTPQVIWSEKLDEGENVDLGVPRNSLPIRGVYAPSNLDAIHVFLGKESISEWQFTVELISFMQQGTPDNPAFVRPFPVEQIGKPFPPGVAPPIPQPSSSPGGMQMPNQGGPGSTKPGAPPFRGDDGSGRDIRQVPTDPGGFVPEPDGGG